MACTRVAHAALQRTPHPQGLLTNDVLPLEAPSAPPVYACLLNAQGRHLHDLLLFRTPGACAPPPRCMHARGLLSRVAPGPRAALSTQPPPPPPLAPAADSVPTVLADVDREGIPDLTRLLRR